MAAATNAAPVPTPEKPPTPDRRRFALAGPSRPLDLRRNAARRDLADIRLAGRWFAPHYAVPERWTCDRDGLQLHAQPRPDSDCITSLTAGESFAVLELSGDWAWGFSEADQQVGYLQISGLAKATAP